MQRCTHKASASERVAGYTLLELLTVIAIMVILMGTVGGMFYGMGRGSRIRGAVSTLTSNLSLARQFAITQRRGINVTFDLDPNVRRMDLRFEMRPSDTNEVFIREPLYLPAGTAFQSLTPSGITNFIFKPDGTVKGATSDIEIRLKEVDAAYSGITTIKLSPLTGLTTVEW